jgi:pimeloyl-ACP methyl ester carboxylesterase
MRRTMTTLTGIAAVTALAAAMALLPGGGAGAAERSRITWRACQTSADDDLGRELDQAGAQCGNLTVPLDYARPNGRTITVAMSRLPATDRANRLGTLLLNTGGPGSSGLGDVLPVREWLRDAGTRYDLIGMDPRFVGRSTPLDCGWPAGTWLRAGGPDRASFESTAAFEADLARRCAQRHGDVLPYVTTRNTARDMDAIRAALAEPTLSYLGYSYGTYLGAVYAQMFPTRVGHMVLDSAVDPTGYGPRLLREVGEANEAALQDWTKWTAVRHAEYGLGSTGAAVLATVDRILAVAEQHPLAVGDFRVNAATVRFLLLDGNADDRDEPNADLAATVRVLDEAVQTGYAEPTASLAESLSFALTGDESAYGSVQAAILCGDVGASRSREAYLRDIRAAMAKEPRFAPLTRNLGPCVFWSPPREQPTRIGNATPALIVQATGDTRTTYEGALVMHAALTGSRMVTLPGARIHAVFGNYGNTCVDNQVITYLRTGLLPATDVTC